jgi:hypothetical protein
MIPLTACYSHLLVPGPSSRAKQTKKNDTINKTCNSNNKKRNSLLIKNIALLRQKVAVLEMGINHKLQNPKMQINYFVNTDIIFQDTLRHKTVKLRIIVQPNHVRQKQFRWL